MVTNGTARCVALFLVVCVAAPPAASGIGNGLVANGNFEESPEKCHMNGTVVMGEYAIPSWRISGFVEYIESGQQQGDMVLAVPEGAHAVRLGNDASIQQQFNLTPDTHYSITFGAARTCAQDEKLNVSVDPGAMASDQLLPIQTVYTSSGWDSYSWAFVATQAIVTFTIHNPGDEEEDPACGPIIDSVAIKTLYPPQSTQSNMLKNGDFEEGPYIAPDSIWGVLVPPMDEDDVSPLPGWMIMSVSKVVKYIDSAHFAVPQGSHGVELVAGVEVALLQEVETVPGIPYRLEFSVGDAANGCVASMSVQAATADGSTSVPYYSQGSGGWKRATLDFTATGNSTRVVFYSLGYHTKSDGTLCGPVVDDASLVGVPQPHARRLLL